MLNNRPRNNGEKFFYIVKEQLEKRKKKRNEKNEENENIIYNVNENLKREKILKVSILAPNIFLTIGRKIKAAARINITMATENIHTIKNITRKMVKKKGIKESRKEGRNY